MVWLWGANIVTALLLAATLHSRPWAWLDSDSRQHAYAGATVVCMLLWSISAKLGGGPSFHLLGTTVLTLMFGPRLAFLAAGIALVGVSAAGSAGWVAYGLNALLMGALPIAVSYGVYRWADRRLPNHFFVYVLVSSFINGALAMTACRLATLMLHRWAGGAAAVTGTSDYLLASILLAWGEALTTGMLMTVFIVYRPGWVKLFDDARYIVGR
jgi:uncharacterized membrane protein